MGRAA
jgi:hypothetical protein